MPAAFTRTRTCPSPGTGRSTSSTRNTSTPPNSSYLTAVGMICASLFGWSPARQQPRRARPCQYAAEIPARRRTARLAARQVNTRHRIMVIRPVGARQNRPPADCSACACFGQPEPGRLIISKAYSAIERMTRIEHIKIIWRALVVEGRWEDHLAGELG